MNDKIDPLRVLLAAFAISSFAGLAALLRSNQALTVRAITSALAYSGVTGLIVALLWYNQCDANSNMYFLLGVSALAGAGGTSILDLLIQVFIKAVSAGGLTVSFKNPPPKDEEPDHGS